MVYFQITFQADKLRTAYSTQIIRGWHLFQKARSKNFFDNIKPKQHFLLYQLLPVAKETYPPL